MNKSWEKTLHVLVFLAQNRLKHHSKRSLSDKVKTSNNITSVRNQSLKISLSFSNLQWLLRSCLRTFFPTLFLDELKLLINEYDVTMNINN